LISDSDEGVFFLYSVQVGRCRYLWLFVSGR